MAEKKKHNIVSADDGSQMTAAQIEEKKKKIKEAAPVGDAKKKRLAAIIFWVVAVIFEILAIMVLQGKINISFLSSMAQLIAFIVLDLVCILIGSLFWKKANHIAPVSEANKTKFWLWNNMGLIVCMVAFLPLIILLLTNKKLDKKTKTIAVVVAVIAALIAGVGSYDFNPVSAEQKQDAMAALNGEAVYWAPFGKVYHTHEDCQSLNQSDTLTMGNVEQAIAAGRTRLCSFCARRDNITGVVTDDKSAEAVEAPVEELLLDDNAA